MSYADLAIHTQQSTGALFWLHSLSYNVTNRSKYSRVPKPCDESTQLSSMVMGLKPSILGRRHCFVVTFPSFPELDFTPAMFTNP